MIPTRLGRGEIVPKPGVERLVGRTVRFVDGSSVEADVIVRCTGYKDSFPLFDPGILVAPGNDLTLWRQLAQLARTTSSSWAFCTRSNHAACRGTGEADRQAPGRALRPALGRGDASRHGTGAMPDARALRCLRAAHEQVDFDCYLQDLAQERRAGERRARTVAGSSRAVTAGS